MSFHGWPSSSGNNAPLTYIRGIPVDVTTLLTAVHVFSMLVVAVMLTMGQSAWGALLQFRTDFLFTGHVWSLVTYPFFHNITEESVFFALEMLMFFWFGREVERFIGRSAFAWFYALLVLLPPVGLAAIRLALPSLIPNVPLYGASVIHFAVFVGFVIIYPNAQLLFGIVAKWMAVVLLGLFSIVCIANHAWFSLSHLWLTVGVAWSMLRMAGVGGGFEWFNWYQTWRMEKNEKRVQARRQRHQRARREAEQSVDAILEKISQQGMASLTPAERGVLERARQKLVQRDGSSS
jgi:membrane associated rhomboid family serine protease